MHDPLADVVALLRPHARHSKQVSGKGVWRIRRTDTGQPFYGAILEGAARLSIEGQAPLALAAGDFALIPAAFDFTFESAEPPPADAPDSHPIALPNGEFRVGVPDGAPDYRALIGHLGFDSPDAALLVSLLPRSIHVRGESRLTTLVQLVREESLQQRPAREEVLSRLLEIVLIEALRTSERPTSDASAPVGLVRGLADVRLAAALRRMHEQPTKNWTVAELANVAALSRSAFFERFSHAVGVAPMEYLLGWRMALAKNLLRRSAAPIAEVARRVGYSSASTFSTAFTRFVGTSPSKFADEAG